MAYIHEKETAIGKLVVEETGDGPYQGIAISLLKGNGEIGTVCWVEVEDLGDGEYELHTLAYDGNDADATGPEKIVCDPDGRDMQYS